MSCADTLAPRLEPGLLGKQYPGPAGRRSTVGADAPRAQAPGSRRRWTSWTMKAALSLLVGIPLLLPAFGGGGHRLSGSEVEQALSAQMNGSRAGHITRQVECVPVGRAAQKGPITYSCSLVGESGARVKATVSVSGRSWRADWAPLKG